MLNLLNPIVGYGTVAFLPYFLLAFIITLVVEGVIVYISVKTSGIKITGGRFIGVLLLAQFSFFLIWIVQPSFTLHATMLYTILTLEIFAVLWEMIFYFYLFNFSFRRAIVTSIVANFASVMVGIYLGLMAIPQPAIFF